MHLKIYPSCLIWILGISLTFYNGINAASAQTAVVNPAPLEVWGDSVIFRANISVPADKAFKREGTYIITPQLGSIKFGQIKISSNKIEDIGKNGIQTEIRSSVYFTDEMLGESLSIKHEYRYGNVKKALPKIDTLAACCITTGRLFLFNSVYSMMHYEYTPTEEEPFSYLALLTLSYDSLHQAQQQYPLEISSIGEYLVRYPDAKVTITSQTSPAAHEELNKKQGLLRAEKARNWLEQQLSILGYASAINPARIKLQTTTEDWRGYKQLLLASQLSPAQQRKIIAAISAGTPDSVAEKEIITLVGSEEAAAPFLKPIRNISVVVSSPQSLRKGFSILQIDSIMQLYARQQLPASALSSIFNKREFLAASLRTNSKEDRLRLLSAYLTQKYADYRIYSDIAVITEMNNNKVDLLDGENAIVGIGFHKPDGAGNKEITLDRTRWKFHTKLKPESVSIGKNHRTLKIDFRDSESLLLQASAITYNSNVVYNNLGAYYIGQGRFADALPYLQRSLQVEDNLTAHYNMGLYYSRMGDYAKATEHFKQVNFVKGVKYNRALARLLSGDLLNAQIDIDNFLLENPKHALGHYVAAIIAARLKQPEKLLLHLQEAKTLTGNNSIALAAVEDLEFREYWDTEAFKAIVVIPVE